MTIDQTEEKAAGGRGSRPAGGPVVIPAAGRYARLLIERADNPAEGLAVVTQAARLRTRERVAAVNGKWHLFVKLLSRLSTEEREGIRELAAPLLAQARGDAAPGLEAIAADAALFGVAKRRVPEALAGEAAVPEEALPPLPDDEYSASREGFLVDMILKRSGLAAEARAEESGAAPKRSARPPAAEPAAARPASSEARREESSAGRAEAGSPTRTAEEGAPSPASAASANPALAVPADEPVRRFAKPQGERPLAGEALPPECLASESTASDFPERLMLPASAGCAGITAEIEPDAASAAEMLERYLAFDGREGRPYGYPLAAASPASLPPADGLAESGRCWCIRAGAGPLADEGLARGALRWSDRTLPLTGRQSVFDWGLAVEDTRLTRTYAVVCETEDAAESAALLSSLFEFLPDERPLVRFQPGSARWLAILPQCYTAGSGTLLEMHRGGRRIARIEGLLSTWVQISGSGPGGEPYLWWPRPLDIRQAAGAAYPLLSLSRWFDFALCRLPGATSFASPEAAAAGREDFLAAAARADEAACLASGEAYMLHALMTPEEAKSYLERIFSAAPAPLPDPIQGRIADIARAFPKSELDAAAPRAEAAGALPNRGADFALHPAESMAEHGKRMKAILTGGERPALKRPAWPFPFDFPLHPFGIPKLKRAEEARKS